MKKHTSLSLIFLILITQLNAKVVYVNENATGSNNGTSWANAFNRLQNALAVCSPNDEVWIAAGTYKPKYTVSGPQDRLVSFVIPNLVRVYGGFAGTETQLSQRNWETNITYLDGNIGSLNSSTDNSCHVVYVKNVSLGTKLDGVHIINGYAIEVDPYDNLGGGVFVESGNITIENSTFTSNFSNNGGAAVANYYNGLTTLNNCTIFGNSSTNLNGSIVFSRNIIRMNKCNIANNQAGTIISPSSNTVLDRCILSGNTAVYKVIESDINIYNSLIVGNICSEGIMFSSSSSNIAEFWNCTVAHNKITSSFNALLGSNLSGFVSYRNCIVWGNDATKIFSSPNAESVENCVIQGGYTGIGNLSTNPLFVSPGSAPNAPFNAQSYNYTLQANSSALNAGNNLSTKSQYGLDLSDSARISGGNVDIGCYEKQYCNGTASITTSGPTSFCGGGFVSLTVPQNGTYSWSNGATSPTVSVSSSGNYSVSVFDNNGCFASAAQQVNVYPATVQITGNTILCNGASQTLTASSNNGTIFSWSNGSSNSSILVSQPGTYTVTVTTTNSCTASSSFSVSQQNVNIPFVTYNNNLLSSTPASSYQWYLNGNTIAGATTQNYTPTQNGNYYVVTTENGCPSANSNTVTVLNVGVEDLAKLNIHVFPNPTSNFVFINSSTTALSRYELVDHIGSVIYGEKLSALDHRIDVSSLAVGVYYLRVEFDKTIQQFPIYIIR